jgi:pantoate--beta-alanine ligase
LAAEELVRNGERAAFDILEVARSTIERAPLARIDYVELVDAENLQLIDSLGERSLLALAVFFGKTRLIDNIQLR